MSPELTVLMAVRNGGTFLPTAVESILRQSYRNFRFLIIEDASTDGTAQQLREYASRDSRVELLCLERNVGQTAALNIGLRHADSPWIARMDADDFSPPERLEAQMKALAGHPEVACVGTAVWEFHNEPERIHEVKRRPAEHEGIWRAALHGSGLIHGSVVINRQAVLDAGGYDERYRFAADRDLFVRFLKSNRAMNLPEPLLGIRRHGGQDSFSLRAADEYIDIFERLLLEDGFPADDRRILRGSLAYAHLFRARCLWAKRQYATGWKDQAQAMRICPKTFLRSSGDSVVKGLVPKRLRSFLQPMKFHD